MGSVVEMMRSTPTTCPMTGSNHSNQASSPSTTSSSSSGSTASKANHTAAGAAPTTAAAVKVKSRDELATEAVDFINQFYASVHREGSKTHKERIDEVLTSIHSTGTYELKETELCFGARTGWRNASRCIGRIQWSKLQVSTTTRQPIRKYFLKRRYKRCLMPAMSRLPEGFYFALYFYRSIVRV